MIANIITVSRIFFSVLLLAFPPHSYPFVAFYLLCGMSDMLDGFVARKLHTENENGAMLDSIADLFFAVAYAVKILPLLNIPLWIWIWTIVIAVTKIANILIASKKTHKFLIEHSLGNKLTGLLLFLLPISVYAMDVEYGATLVCIVATATVIKEMANQKENYIS